MKRLARRIATLLGRGGAPTGAAGDPRMLAHLAAITARLDEPWFVKVGAHDGLTADPCGRTFLEDRRWHGLLVEPAPHCFERLEQVYRDRRRFILERVAVGAPAGTRPFYHVSPGARDALPGLPDWHDQLGSFDRGHILRHLDGVLEPWIEETPVAVEPLDDLLARHGIDRVDLLQVDTEGHDLAVLQSLDFDRVRPGSVLVEHHHLAGPARHGLEALLRGQGYRLEDWGGDYFASGAGSPENARG